MGRHDDLRDPGLGGNRAGEQRRHPTVGEHREVTWVIALVDTHLAKGVDHVGDGDVVHRRGRLLGRPAVSGAELREHRSGRVSIERPAAAEVVGGVDEVHHDHRVGHRGPRAATPVTGGAGVGAGAFRPDLGNAAAIGPGDAAAAGTDADDVDRGEAGDQRLVSEWPALGVGELAATQERHVEARPSHVGADHVRQLELLGERPGGDHTADRARVHQLQGLLGRLRGQQGAAEALEEAEALRRQPPALELGFQALDVGDDVVADEGGEQRRVPALELARERMDLAGGDHVEVGVELLHDLLGPHLVRAVLERPEEDDGDRLHPTLLDQPPRRGANLVLVERRDDVAVLVDALGDLERPLPVDDRRRRRLLVVVEDVEPGAAGDPEGVTEAARDEHSHRPAAQLGHGVGDHRRPVDDPRAVGEQILELEPEVVGDDLEAVDHAVGKILLRGQGLAVGDRGGRRDDDVGMGATDVDADLKAGARQFPGSVGLRSPRPSSRSRRGSRRCAGRGVAPPSGC